MCHKEGVEETATDWPLGATTMEKIKKKFKPPRNHSLVVQTCTALAARQTEQTEQFMSLHFMG